MPASAEIDYATNRWTPLPSEVGSKVRFKIETDLDPCGESASQSWKVRVYASRDDEAEHVLAEGTGSWKMISEDNLPESLPGCSSVWTGSKMIVWGGYTGHVGALSGGIYDPVTDSWGYTTTSGVPAPRSYHAAFWTGDEMLIWGGGVGASQNNGAIYTP